MKKYLLMLVCVISFSLYGTQVVLNVDNNQDVLNYVLIDEDDNINVPVLLEDSEGQIAYNSHDYQNAMYYFLNSKYNQVKEQDLINDPNGENLDSPETAKLEIILSLMNQLANVARDSGNLYLYNIIQQDFSDGIYN